ncbi:MAG: type III-A CRISPR-associated RAMP protein Csm3 [Nitrospirae bacterium]|nr:type III-A CRISPR-associated RAMP protein Csm3 [Nitrospirota bacterium]
MNYKPGLLGNIVIKGLIEAKTGLHIGTSQDTVEIGGIDSPVIKHPITGAPYIPGSSLKGKMRSFMEKIASAKNANIQYNRNSGRPGNPIMQHVCNDIEEFLYEDKIKGPGAKNCEVCRVYGSTGEKGMNNFPSKIIVRDSNLNKDRLKDVKPDKIFVFEAKMENAIDRVTSAAQPRTFERVPAGATFDFEIVYKVQGHFANDSKVYFLTDTEISHAIEDVKNIFLVLSIISHDGLGGSVSRGYGQVVFFISKKESKYYKAAGNAGEFLSDTINVENGYINDLEKLRLDNFDILKNSIENKKKIT